MRHFVQQTGGWGDYAAIGLLLVGLLILIRMARFKQPKSTLRSRRQHKVTDEINTAYPLPTSFPEMKVVPPPVHYVQAPLDDQDLAEAVKEGHSAALHAVGLMLIAQGLRAEVLLSDWGPDFTGEGGTLPRWRWVVQDADYALKNFLYDRGVWDGEPNPHPLMLGNEPTPTAALVAAARWIEENHYKVQFVMGLLPETTGGP